MAHDTVDVAVLSETRSNVEEVAPIMRKDYPPKGGLSAEAFSEGGTPHTYSWRNVVIGSSFEARRAGR